MNAEINSEAKFTKGEKCLFAHLVISFSLILLVVILYLVHLFLVEHTLEDVFITRRSLEYKTDSPILDTIPIGQLYVSGDPIIDACNTLLLNPQWSVGPGHCIAIRSEPDLSNLLNAWSIKYKYDRTDVRIQKSIVHPHFDRDTFANNIGLVRHASIRGVDKFKMQMFNYFKNENNVDTKDFFIVSWNRDEVKKKDSNIGIYEGQIMNKKRCIMHMAPINELRPYEFCVEINNKRVALGHGALMVDRKDVRVHGFFTWGESRDTSLPLVFLSLSDFQNWLNVFVTS